MLSTLRQRCSRAWRSSQFGFVIGIGSYWLAWCKRPHAADLVLGSSLPLRQGPLPGGEAHAADLCAYWLHARAQPKHGALRSQEQAQQEYARADAKDAPACKQAAPVGSRLQRARAAGERQQAAAAAASHGARLAAGAPGGGGGASSDKGGCCWRTPRAAAILTLLARHQTNFSLIYRDFMLLNVAKIAWQIDV
jgi:hypothetical protein